MSDHSWIHIQIVVNIALRLFRLLNRRGVEPDVVTDHGMTRAGRRGRDRRRALLHDTGMSIHRTDHEAYSLFLAADKLGEPARGGLRGARSARSSRPRRCTRSSATAAAASRSRSRPASCASPTRSTWPRAARGCRSRRAGRTSTRCPPPRSRRCGSSRARTSAVRIEIEMNNSAGIFQVDELLATKLRGSGLEEQIEVIAADRRRAREAPRADLPDLDLGSGPGARSSVDRALRLRRREVAGSNPAGRAR